MYTACNNFLQTKPELSSFELSKMGPSNRYLSAKNLSFGLFQFKTKNYPIITSRENTYYMHYE